MRSPSLKMLEWLHLLEVKPGSIRYKTNIGYRCMQNGWTEWRYVNAKGEGMTWIEARARYGDKYWDHVTIHGELLTDAGRTVLAENWPNR